MNRPPRLNRLQQRRIRLLILGLVAWITVGLLTQTTAAGEAVRSAPERPAAVTQVAQTVDAAIIDQGRQHYEAGQYAAAIRLWQQGVKQPDPLQQAQFWRYLALAYHKLGDWSQAQQAIQQSFEQLQLSGSHAHLLAQTLNTQGQLQLSMGQPEAALQSWQQAEAYYRAAEDGAGQIGSQINQAQALQTLGLYRRAQQLLTTLHDSLQAQPDSQLKLLGLHSLGNVLQVTGNLTASQQVLQQSLVMAEQLQPQQVSAIQFSLANTLRLAQSTEAALQLYQQAASTALTPTEQLQAQLNQLSLLIERRPVAQAEALAIQLQPQISQLPLSRDSVDLQVNFATQLVKLANQSANYQLSAVQLLNRAIQQAQDLSDGRAESYAVGQLAAIYEQTQQWEIAEPLSQRALLLAQTAHADDVAYRWQWQLGRILKQRDPAAARAAYTDALTTLGRIRRDLLSTHPEFQVSFRADVEPLYRELVELLVQPGANSDDLRLAREAIEALRLAELENFFRSACLEPAQQIDRLDPTAAIFYPILLPNQLLVIVSLPDQPLRYHPIAVAESEVERVVEAFRRSLILPYSAEREIHALGHQIYRWMVEPVAATLVEQQIETLVFVQDGILQTIPMAALYDGHRYLVETYSIAFTPGLQLFEPKPLNQVPLKAVTAGLTEARHRFEPLEFVEIELAQIRSTVPSDLLLNQDFTSTALTDRLNQSATSILHIATHGQFSSQADQTFILAWDQPITAHQLSQLLQPQEQSSNNLELLVLSACETAIGDKRAALGLAGIALESGARSTLASLWLIDDQSTPLLMTEFYQALKTGTSKAAALRTAQLKLLQGDYRHPRWWAAFVLLGNWR